MRTKRIGILLTVLISMVATKAFAYDIAVENEDKVTIYYNYINGGAELEVTYRYDENTPSYSGEVVIPSEITDDNTIRKVTSIGDFAFYDCSGLTSVTIPNSVTSIGDYAFDGCNGLISITIPNSVTSIESYAFTSCNGLTSITIPNSVTFIDNDAFWGCCNLTSIVVENGNSVYDSRNDCNAIIETQTNTLIKGCNNSTIPNSVTSICYWAFFACKGLTSITIPNSVTSIGSNAFTSCRGLTSITIPNSVTSIGESVFSDCNGLTSVTIPNSVTSIGKYAFSSCRGLTSITIPNSVTSIGERAFWNCSSLSTIISMIENPFEIPDEVFNSGGKLYVPIGTIEKYQTTKGWKDFLHIGEINGDIVCATPTISYQNGTLSFYCATEGAMCQYSITDSDIKTGSAQEVKLDVTYNISVYATKNGYFDSETATATLCWIEANPQNEGITTDVNQIAAVAVLIKANGGQLTIEGADDNTTITAYTIDGVQLGSAVSKNGVATINTNVSAGTVTIVKIGNKSVKVVMK